MSTSNNNPKGILLILIGMALFSIQDSLIKYVFEDLSLYELYFGRTFVATVWLFSSDVSGTEASPCTRNNTSRYK